MDAITCEAPLDSSFQKDRRELVSKGSLGRRRKPSRSNLRHILCPPGPDSGQEALCNGVVCNGNVQKGDGRSVADRVDHHSLRNGAFCNGNVGSTVDRGDSVTNGAFCNGNVRPTVDRADSVTNGAFCNGNVLPTVDHGDSVTNGAFCNGNVPEDGSVAGQVDRSLTNGTSCNGLLVTEGPNNSCNDHRRSTKVVDPQLQVAANNYKNVIASISQLHHKVGDEVDYARDLRNGTSNVYSVIIKNREQSNLNGAISNGDGNGINKPKRMSCEDFNGNSYNRFAVSNGSRQTYQSRDSIVSNYHAVAGQNKSNSRSGDAKCTNFKSCSQESIDKKNCGSPNLNRINSASANSFSRDQNGEWNGAKRVVSTSSSCGHSSVGKSQQRPAEARPQQQVITFSNNRKIVTSTPIPRDPPVAKNESHAKNQVTSLKGPGLPRSSALVAEAHQFSIEAKLKRKQAEDTPGRSAVLIQTWERRNQSSDPRPGPPKNNRFAESQSPVPESSSATRKGTGQSLEKGQKTDGSISKGRAANSGQKMTTHQSHGYNRFAAHQTPKSTCGRPVVNGRSTGQEPEWVSLSRKICAKFVEGHPGRASPDSYKHEEPEGGSRAFSPPSEQPRTSPAPLSNREPSKNPPRSPHPPPREVSRVRTVLPPPVVGAVDLGSSVPEPPWVHLSRKLCNKFIEEHIEYPPISNGHFVEVPELVEPNGDIRIIEKVGRPKSSRARHKDRQPEWVSLSRKLRAKFIESHLDDPETVALDNQLNASDPDETSSTESLSDSSREVDAGLKHQASSCNLHEPRIAPRMEPTIFFEQNARAVGSGPTMFPAKECCWEYQEMEFDQESMSGTFQEADYSQEPLQEARILRESLPEDSLEPRRFEHNCGQGVSECFNNDVRFGSHSTANGFVPLDLNDGGVRSFECTQSERPTRVVSGSQGHSPGSCGGRESTAPPRSSSHSTSRHQESRLEESHSKSPPARQELSSRCGQEHLTKGIHSSPEHSSVCHQDSLSKSSGDLRPAESSTTSFHHSKGNAQGNKLITVQFVSPSNKSRNRHSVALDGKSDLHPVKQSAIHGSFFNLSTWEEAHSRQSTPKDSLSSRQDYLDRDLRSKSLDNLFDSLEGGLEASGSYAKESKYSSSKSPTTVSCCLEAGTSFEAFDVGSPNDSSFEDSRAEYAVVSPRSNFVPNDCVAGDKHVTQKEIASKNCQVYANGDVCLGLKAGSQESVQKRERKRPDSELSFMDRYMETLNEELKNDSRDTEKRPGENGNRRENYNRETPVRESGNVRKEGAYFASRDKTSCDSDRAENASDASYRKSFKDAEGLESDISERYCVEFLERELNRNSKAKTVKSDAEVLDRRKATTSEDAHSYGKISPQRNAASKKPETTSDCSDNKVKHSKCNGVIPNSIQSSSKNESPPKTEHSQKFGVPSNDPPKLGMSKWITISRSENNVNKVGSTSSSNSTKGQRGEPNQTNSGTDCNGLKLEKRCFEKRYSDNVAPASFKYSDRSGPTRCPEPEMRSPVCDSRNGNVLGSVREFDLKNRCKSLCDVSFGESGSDLRHHQSVDDLASAPFDFSRLGRESEVPLCARLVSEQESDLSSKLIRNDKGSRLENALVKSKGNVHSGFSSVGTERSNGDSRVNHEDNDLSSNRNRVDDSSARRDENDSPRSKNTIHSGFSSVRTESSNRDSRFHQNNNALSSNRNRDNDSSARRDENDSPRSKNMIHSGFSSVSTESSGSNLRVYEDNDASSRRDENDSPRSKNAIHSGFSSVRTESSSNDLRVHEDNDAISSRRDENDSPGSKNATHSGFSSVRTDRSDASHVYEDMFKETPSDSEASSWTAAARDGGGGRRSSSYYVSGRSSSLNDLDDSCSMSVHCDCEGSSTSGGDTLRSRASSSFYVNLRDYDQHMLEPGRRRRRAAGSGPPTPESLRHLFTSPPTAVRPGLSRAPSDPHQSHYYSTASSAFKHGFAPAGGEGPPPRGNKKADRSSSMKLRDFAQGILLTFKRLHHGHSRQADLASRGVDVSHLAENGNPARARMGDDQWTEDSGFASDVVQRSKPRRSSSDLTGLARTRAEVAEAKKGKASKKKSKEKGKKSKSKDPRPVPTVSRKVQQGADGTLYLVTTVSGDSSALPSVYSDSPDTSSEISTHRPVRMSGESNC